MRRGLFGKLAVQNIRNNRSTYIPYMLTCIFCIAMMYMMEFLRDCPTLEKAVPQASEVRLIVGTGEVVVGIFCVIFLIYSNSFLMKRRQKEIGLYNILGLEKGHIGKVMFLETIMTSLLSLAAGIGFGILGIGVGLLILALALVGLVFLVWAATKVLPAILRKFVDFCSRLVNRGSKKKEAGL